MTGKLQETEFVKHLHAEKMRTQEARTAYTLRKLTYATALLGFGSLNIQVGQFDFSLLLYLVPWMALAFDLYIMGEDYSVKRIGAFLGANGYDPLEEQWEDWVSQNRDPFAPLAMPILTTLLLLGAAAVIAAVKSTVVTGKPTFWLWLVLSGLPSWLSFLYYRSLRKRLIERAQSLVSGLPEPVEPLGRLIAAVEAADYQFNETTYHQALRLFNSCLSNEKHLRNVRRLAAEYGRSEFLLCVDAHGTPVYPGESTVEDLRGAIALHPEFRDWICEAQLPDHEEPVLLVARWLCHLVGFRHRTVHLFIDHPTLTDHTLVQVRAVNKAESPGCFGLPVAGHVTGTESVEETLFKELEEELQLGPEALEGLVRLGSYEYRQPSSEVGFRNVEYRIVYQSRLNREGWMVVSAADHEVAAIAAFSSSELEGMISHFPERVASGLAASLRLYSERPA